MQTEFIHNEIAVACGCEETKAAWHQPKVSRIDIKRTMAGAGSASDGSAFTT